jgi:hypothetical protein
LDFAEEFYLLLGGAVSDELVGPAIKEDGAGGIAILFVYFCQFQRELGILSQKKHFVIGLYGFSVFLFSSQVPSQG